MTRQHSPAIAEPDKASQANISHLTQQRVKTAVSITRKREPGRLPPNPPNTLAPDNKGKEGQDNRRKER